MIAESRANGGRVGGNFEGAPMALVHHRGRKTGRAEVEEKTRGKRTIPVLALRRR
nr:MULTISPECIES: nitroreductase/quinone reductase family protein [unclassified Rhodococcus (in: high G+C Gram-positive bacteria)]